MLRVHRVYGTETLSGAPTPRVPVPSIVYLESPYKAQVFPTLGLGFRV